MKKILIIEDDAVLGDVLLQKLQAAGYECELAREGAKGLERMRGTKPDLIVLDIFMPLLNGLEVLKQKKEESGIADIPTIVLTNSYHPVDGTEIQKLGITDFLVKSQVTPEQIIERIAKVFNMVLPTTSIEPSTAGEGRKGTNILQGKNILVVEDDDFLGSIMSSRIKSEAGLVILAKNGEDALAELQRQKFDAVLLDILLPGIDGFEVLKSIRGEEKTKKLPVTILSNFNQVKDRERATAMDADFFVKALVDPDEIVAQVKKMLTPAA